MGTFGDFSRINTNIQALQALHQMQRTNLNLGIRQLRLSTGSRINRAEDDSAGYTIAKKLEARVRGQAQALANVGDAKSMLTVAEGAFGTIMDILMTMKEKTVQAANDTLGSDERTAIQTQMHALSDEITELLADTTFNSAPLFTSSTLSFQINADAGDTFKVTLGTLSVSQLGLTTSSIVVSSAGAASTLLGTIDSALTTVANKLGDIGSSQARLTFRQESLSTAISNNEAARSRIADADFAKEQMEIVKLQILQQTGVAALGQANTAPQTILQLLGN
ncbi:MAG: flagellin [Bacteroidetes bacterium]|nr:flagellin [Bacteroidota bacterium]